MAAATRDLATARSTHLELAALLTNVIARESTDALELIYTGAQTAELVPLIIEHLTEVLLDDETYARFLSYRDELTAIGDFSTLFDGLPSTPPFHAYDYSNFAPRVNAAIKFMIDPTIVDVPELPTAAEVAEHIEQVVIPTDPVVLPPTLSRSPRASNSLVDDEAMEMPPEHESIVDEEEEPPAMDVDPSDSSSPIVAATRRRRPPYAPSSDSDSPPLAEPPRKRVKKQPPRVKKKRVPGF